MKGKIILSFNIVCNCCGKQLAAYIAKDTINVELCNNCIETAKQIGVEETKRELGG